MSSMQLEPILKYSGIVTHILGKSADIIYDKFISDPSDLQNIHLHTSREIAGYANTIDLDRVDDIVTPEAFKKSIETYMKNPVLRLNHKEGTVIGNIIEARITKKGLWIKARVHRKIDQADDAWKSILQGGLRAFSIFGKPLKQHQKRIGGKTVNYIDEFDLQEIAIVDVPANQESIFEIVAKGINMPKEVTNTDEEPREKGNELSATSSKSEDKLDRVLEMISKSLEVTVKMAELQKASIEQNGQLMSKFADIISNGAVNQAAGAQAPPAEGQQQKALPSENHLEVDANSQATKMDEDGEPLEDEDEEELEEKSNKMCPECDEEAYEEGKGCKKCGYSKSSKNSYQTIIKRADSILKQIEDKEANEAVETLAKQLDSIESLLQNKLIKEPLHAEAIRKAAVKQKEIDEVETDENTDHPALRAFITNSINKQQEN